MFYCFLAQLLSWDIKWGTDKTGGTDVVLVSMVYWQDYSSGGVLVRDGRTSGVLVRDDSGVLVRDGSGVYWQHDDSVVIVVQLLCYVLDQGSLAAQT